MTSWSSSVAAHLSPLSWQDICLMDTQIHSVIAGPLLTNIKNGHDGHQSLFLIKWSLSVFVPLFLPNFQLLFSHCFFFAWDPPLSFSVSLSPQDSFRNEIHISRRIFLVKLLFFYHFLSSFKKKREFKIRVDPFLLSVPVIPKRPITAPWWQSFVWLFFWGALWLWH